MGKKLKNYNKDDMDRAYDMVKNGSSRQSAACICKVPNTSLQRRVNRELKRQGKKPLLSNHDEEQLVKYAKFMAQSGVPMTPSWLCNTAGRLRINR